MSRLSRLRCVCAIAAFALLGAATAVPAGAVAQRTEITVRGSDFGRMIWAPRRQAIYMFGDDGLGTVARGTH